MLNLRHNFCNCFGISWVWMCVWKWSAERPLFWKGLRKSRPFGPDPEWSARLGLWRWGWGGRAVRQMNQTVWGTASSCPPALGSTWSWAQTQQAVVTSGKKGLLLWRMRCLASNPPLPILAFVGQATLSSSLKSGMILDYGYQEDWRRQSVTRTRDSAKGWESAPYNGYHDLLHPLAHLVRSHQLLAALLLLEKPWRAGYAAGLNGVSEEQDGVAAPCRPVCISRFGG